jgi:hypothetical protein
MISNPQIQNQSLAKLKELTKNLLDRDLIRVRDVNLFKHFLENSPIRICLWTLDNNLNILHQKCICPESKDTTVLTDKFFEGSFKESLLEQHKTFVTEEISLKQVLVGDDEHIFVVTLKKENSFINGAALEITARVRMLHILLGILEEAKDENPQMYEEIRAVIGQDHFSMSILKLMEGPSGN